MNFDKIAAGIIDYLKAKKILGYLPEIIEALEKRGLADSTKNLALIETSAPLNQAQKKALREGLTAVYGRNLSFKIRLQPELMAGLKISVNNRVIDLSFNRQLELLEENFRYE